MGKACTHPVIVNGKCADCGAVINAQNGANFAVAKQDGQTHAEAAKQPENGQETQKKATRKRKA